MAPAPSTPVASAAFAPTMCTSGLTHYARRILTSADPLEKVRLTHEAARQWAANREVGSLVAPPARPARPAEPAIVPPGEIPSAKESPAPPNVYHLHSLAHVELNAIDLCFDTMLRFAPGLSDAVEKFPDITSDPDAEPASGVTAWFADWVSIAADEARHFALLHDRLRALGSRYGALPAHAIVWDGAEASRNSRRDRIAAGQLVAEARGLDAGPRFAARLGSQGDHESSGIVKVIADEEVRHVRIGVKWFVWECDRVGADPVKTFHEVAVRLGNPGSFSKPFNEDRRRLAGLTPEWYLPVSEAIMERRAKLREERAATENGVNAATENGVNAAPARAT